MSRAVCATCGRMTHWSASRGARLADLRCPCGGELKAYRTQEASERPWYASIKTPAEHAKHMHSFRAGLRGADPRAYFGMDLKEYGAWGGYQAAAVAAYRAGAAIRDARGGES